MHKLEFSLNFFFICIFGFYFAQWKFFPLFFVIVATAFWRGVKPIQLGLLISKASLSLSLSLSIYIYSGLGKHLDRTLFQTLVYLYILFLCVGLQIIGINV